MDTQTNIESRAVHGAKALFWYLTLFFTLGLTAFNTGNVWFQYINKLVPLEVAGGYVSRSFSQGSLKFAIASLLVATPVFFLFSWLIRRELSRGNLNPKLGVRVWISYVILFIAIAIAVGDLIATVFSVMNGDYTVRFILKSLSILVIVSWIFVYYYLELRSPNALVKTMLPRIFGIITAVVVVASFIGSFFLIDSPAVARARAFDQNRVNDLSQLSAAVEDHYRINQKLPATLDELTPTRAYLELSDPKTNEPYKYKTTGAASYELCATFETESVNDEETPYMYGYEYTFHIGENCYPKNVPPEPGDVKAIIPVR